MIISFFNSAKDSKPRPRDLTWHDFCEILKPLRVSTGQKTDSPAFSPTEFEPGKTRANKHAKAVSAAVLDLDKITDAQLAEVLASAEKMRFCAYSSWSHAEHFDRSGKYCLRLVVPLTRPVTAKEWPAFHARLMGMFKNIPDPACKDLQRMYFYGEAPTAERRIFLENQDPDAAVLNPDDVLALPAPQAASEKPPAQKRECTRDDLKKLADRLRNRVGDYDKESGAILRKVIAGEVFAEPGERDNTLFRLSNIIVEEISDVSPASVAKHFAPSLALMGAGAPDAPAEKDVVAKLERAQTKKDAADLIAAAPDDEEMAALCRRAFGTERSTPYSQDELKQFAENQNTTPEGFQSRWIIQSGRVFYVFIDGVYQAPVIESSAANGVPVWLAPAFPLGVELRIKTEKGYREKKFSDIVKQYGSQAIEIRAVLGLERSYYDPATRIFYESAAKPRTLSPEFHKGIDEWLKALSGSSYDKLCDWLASVPDLRHPTAALYLEGPPKTGKSLLGSGVARLWSEAEPIALKNVLGTNFNSDMRRCPLILADESLPQFLSRGGSTAELRSFIQERTRTLNVKFMQPITLEGSIRLVITANNDELFHLDETPTDDDINAIKERFLHIHAEEAARAVLERYRTQVEDWVYHDGIARHVLWLSENRVYEKGTRLLVEGVDSELHRSLSWNSGYRQTFFLWLVGYLRNPEYLSSEGNFSCVLKNGELLVQSTVFTTHWGRYVKEQKQPPVSAISKVLKAISTKKKTVRVKGERGHFWVIDKEKLLNWVEETNFGDREELESKFNASEANDFFEDQKEERIVQ